MAGRHRERLMLLATAFIEAVLVRRRRHVATATAIAFVLSAVLLGLGTVLPFPLPGERVLYDSRDWSLLFGRGAGPAAAVRPGAAAAPSSGGLSSVQPRVAFLLYTVRPGDTMGTIATKLGVSVDTLSSMNRVQGRGVHTVVVGETLKVPSMDGIMAALDGDFDAFCEKKGVAADDVLAANGITRADLSAGMVLFLPGVQHTGFELALSTGTLVALPLRGWKSSAFGRRADPFTGAPSRHSGIDIAAGFGTPIKSATDGTVVQARFDPVLGNFVEVRAFGGWSYVYGHMSQVRAAVGRRVAQGDVLGYVGSTGYATGPHLHFEVRLNGRPQNPANYLYGLR